jgi:hypothetical protein
MENLDLPLKRMDPPFDKEGVLKAPRVVLEIEGTGVYVEYSYGQFLSVGALLDSGNPGVFRVVTFQEFALLQSDLDGDAERKFIELVASYVTGGRWSNSLTRTYGSWLV